MAGLIRGDVAMVGLGLLRGSLLFLAYVYARIHGNRLRCEVMPPRHVECSKPFGYRLHVANAARFLDCWSLELELKANGEPLSKKHLPWIPARGECGIDLEAVIARRGRQKEWSLGIRTLAPFGLMQSSLSRRIAVDLLVRPRAVWTWRPAKPGYHGFHEGDQSWHDGMALDGEPRGLRAWHVGDKPRAIVWPASLRSMAQGAGWLVRDVDPPGNGWAEFLVLFHSYGGGGTLIRPWSFEEALGHVAGCVRYFVRRGLRASLLADFNDWDTWQCKDSKELGAFYDRLALVERSAGTEVHEVQEAIMKVPLDRGLIVLSDFPAEVWKPALAEAGDRVWTRPETRVNRLRREVSR